MTAANELENARALSELRSRIDAIDADIHRLLIERGSAIDTLIRVKGTSTTRNAFRPGREADMMRRLVARHRGGLPLVTVEHIWREIITTFTRMQAPFGVAIDGAAPADRMRDIARFYFGFSVDLAVLSGPAAVVARVAEGNDLGVVAMNGAGVPWWRALAGDGAPRVIGVLPFIRLAKRPADLPALVISPGLADPVAPELRIYGVTANAEIRGGAAIAVLASAADGGRREALVAAPADLSEKAVAAACSTATVATMPVGAAARGIAVDGPPSVLYASPAGEGGGR